MSGLLSDARDDLRHALRLFARQPGILLLTGPDSTGSCHDNEWGYAHRVVDLMRLMTTLCRISPGALTTFSWRKPPDDSVIERDEWTCGVPECLLRGRPEADHMTLRSRGGPTVMPNLVSLCAMDHRFTKHEVRSVSLSGEAPARVFVRVGRRLYLNDRLLSPAFDSRVLDEDPWAPAERHMMHAT